MSTAYARLFTQLAAPFDRGELKFFDSKGRRLWYVTARTAANRLDTVLGPENWRDSYTETAGGGLRCRLELRVGGEWIWKEDGGAAAGMGDEDNDEKSAYSSAFKRAAAKWGVGRYLYNDGVPDFAGEPADATPAPAPAPAPAPGTQPDSRETQSAPPPRDLGWVHNPDQGREREPAAPVRTNVNGRPHGDPRNGRAFFAWLKDQGENNDVPLLDYIGRWARLQGYPQRFVDWSPKQVEVGLDEARRHLDQSHDDQAEDRANARLAAAGVGADA